MLNYHRRYPVTVIADRALVLGASMAGLQAARVLADYYTTVTVVEDRRAGGGELVEQPREELPQDL